MAGFRWDAAAPIILGVTAILSFAVIGRYFARRLGQPTVLGELVIGIALGNLVYLLGGDFILVVREGRVLFDMIDLTFAGLSMEEAAAASHHSYAAAAKHLELHPDDARALYLGAGSLVELGELNKARVWADRALDTDRSEPAVLYNVACVYSLIGERDPAIDLLGEAIDNGFGYRAWLENDNMLEPLRDDPRFAELLRRLD